MESGKEELPAYLKSLEALLEGSAGGAGAPAAAPAPAPVQTLSSIGFGSLFAGEGLATRGMGGAAAGPAGPEGEKLRFLLVSTHAHQFTGYSKISYGILKELSRHPWLSITHFGFQKFHDVPPTYRPYPAGVEVIDAVQLEKPPQQGFGYSALPDVIRRKKPHVVMIYNDLAVVTQFVEQFRKSGVPRNFKLWVYCDQVYTTQNQPFLDMLNRDADRIFAFTPFWKKCLKDQGITRPVDVLLHGFDKERYFSVPRDLARKQLNLPTDMFLFLNVNRNQPRKRYDLLVMAFVELIVKYPTKPLYLLCLCDKGEKGGWWLFEIFSRELRLRGASIEQFGGRLIITSQNMSFKDEEINMFYNAADAGISTADGEGWGLCQFEQMGVGVPQVVPDIGGYKEFCLKENSMLVEPKVRYYHPTAHCPVGGEAFACDPHDICLAMEEYVLNSQKRAEHGKAAKEKVLTYTWERACEQLVRRLREAKEDDE
jgi:glycosyltransferase involved in cell wall biosynthesis